MSQTIEKIAVAEERMREMWGVSAYRYTLNNQNVDLQDMLVEISTARASSIEDQVTPLKDIISKRNDRLEKEGVVLQKLTELQAKFTDDDTNPSVSLASIKDSCSISEFWAILEDYGYSGDSSSETLQCGKSACEGLVSRCKSSIDAKNNAAQSDMTRLQSVVDRRDESYSTATSLMTSVSDTRSATIKNM